MNCSDRLCKLCNVKPNVVTDYELHEIEIYPDLTEPRNLIKLLDIRILNIAIVRTFLTSEKKCKNVVKKLYEFLSNTEIPESIKERIKKAIKRIKWYY